MNNSLLCIGLDSDVSKISSDQFTFNKAIIDATHKYVCAYKPNIAFYESEGPAGLTALKKTVEYIHSTYPGISVIMDAKRGDIESTNLGYLKLIFDYLEADAVTVSPYLGRTAIKPFLDRSDKLIIILCKTSNAGSGEFQDLLVPDRPLWQVVAEKVAKEWNVNGNCGLVMGATYPNEIKLAREIVGKIPFLVPGIGSQGGDLEAVIRNGLGQEGEGLIINASRSVIFATDPEAEAKQLWNQINAYKQSSMSDRID